MLQDLLDIHDVMEPMHVPEQPVPWWLFATASVLLLAFGLWRVWRRRRRRPKRGDAPERVAWRALSQLSATQGRELYAALSAVLTAYLANRFEIDISRLTSSETLAALSRRIVLNRDSTAALENFLDLCDRGKFAPRCDATAEAAIHACREVIRNLAVCSRATPEPAGIPVEGAVHAV